MAKDATMAVYVIEKLQSILTKRNLTMYRFAKDSGIALTLLSAIINRRNVPTLTSLQRICNGLGITLSQFFAEGEVTPSLTSEQKSWLDLYDNLTPVEKAKVEAYIQGMKASK